jgi:hypothetical protein
MPDIAANSWNRYVTTHFCVKADLMGATHEFLFENHRVLVRLPRVEHADRDENKYDEVARLSSYRGDSKEPLTFTIIKVDVEVDVIGKISVPDDALTKPPSQYEAFSVEQKKVVDEICESHPGIAERAFEYWLEILRWSSGFALIGQPEISNNRSGWSTYIFDKSTQHRVWGCGSITTINKGFEVSKDHWEIARAHLAKGDNLPMHLRFLHGAEASARNAHYEKSILELAMACEIYLRFSVFSFIPDGTPRELATYIEEANINKYIGKFFKSLVPREKQSEYSRLAKDISSLMSRRNSYVHMGQMDGADRERCRRYINAAKLLFTIKLSNEST